MLPAWALFLMSAGYLALLFGIAAWGDARARQRQRHPLVYALAISVYCTSWTFYGAVGRAASDGLAFLPIYLGPALVFTLGYRWLARMVQLSKRHNLTSVADFIGARYGRSPSLAALVVLVALVGVLPYLALQLKAVAYTFDELVRGHDSGVRLPDTALAVALLLALFAVLFGTRQVLSSESHRGMVLAVAFESAVKLAAFVAMGLFAVFAINGGLPQSLGASARLARIGLDQPLWWLAFAVQTMLAGAAVLCLPRQFHVTIVEHAQARDLPTARRIFPLYLALFSLFVLPVAAAGLAALPGTAADVYLLALPQQAGQTALTLAVYIGGFSAATSMVIVASIALATMVCNEWVLPVALRFGLARRRGGDEDLTDFIKGTRRIAIFAVAGLAWAFHHYGPEAGGLASLGLVSFAAIAQLAPPLLIGLYWSRATRNGATLGLLTGALVWLALVLLPVLRADGVAVDISTGALLSLAGNLLVLVGISLLRPSGLSERLAAGHFLREPQSPSSNAAAITVTATVADLYALLERFLGAERASAFISDGPHAQLSRQERAPAGFARDVERLLASALGAGTARLALSSALSGRDMQPDEVIRLLDASSHHAMEISGERLSAALENLPQGVSVVDRDLRLVAWNRRYVELFGYPDPLVHVGAPIEQLIRHNIGRGLLGGDDAEALIARRLVHLREGGAYVHERELPDGTVIEIRGNPMPGGGFVTSYADVSSYKRAEAALREINETLEDRVEARTQELTQLNLQLAEAKSVAERADAAKTRFLAAATHDLAQPIHAARLFLAAAENDPASAQTVLNQLGRSLAAAEQLLAGLLDISRLDAGGLPVQRRAVAVSEVLQPLADEAAAIAADKGLRFRFRGNRRLALDTDPVLLRRIVQNFLSNALRYTERGGVLLGVRRLPGAVRIEVRDSGPGIPAAQHTTIFEEFRRGPAAERAQAGTRGLGLGLSIAQRMAARLGHALSLRSLEGRGSCFAITVPLAAGAAAAEPAPPSPSASAAGGAGDVLCIENEALVADSLAALLRRWGYTPHWVRDEREALAWAAAHPAPRLLLIDYHLDHGATGIDVARRLRAQWPVAVRGIVLTADHTPQARSAALDAGYALLAKPVKPASLRALMQGLI